MRTISEIGDLVVEDESVREVEDLKWYKRPLMNEQVVQLENFAPLKAKRYISLTSHVLVGTDIQLGLFAAGRLYQETSGNLTGS